MVSTDIPISENQFDWFKGVDTEATVINHVWQLLSYRIQASVPKVLLTKETIIVCSNDTTRTQVKKGIQRTPPYLTYIRDSIDQGATRLGGL